jgi:hypothetical protein
MSSVTSGELPKSATHLPWVLIWIVAILLFVVGLASVESAWRALGYRPTAVDSPALWKLWYERATAGGPKTIVLIGASRIQAGISADRMRVRLPDYQIMQLGKYAGDSPVGVLRALANDRRFDGIVICDMLAPFLMRERWESQRDLYESRATSREQLDAYEIARAADLLAVKGAESGISAAVRRLIDRGDLPSPNHIRMRPDRSLEIDFAVMDNLQSFREKNAASYRRQYETAEHPAPADLDDDFEEVNDFVRRIRDRGGQVVFLRMPSSGGRLAIEEEYHPKAKFWDRFAAVNSGICIHWSEIEGTGNLTCPDDSHLDYRDAVKFTDLLVDTLIKRGVIAAQSARFLGSIVEIQELLGFATNQRHSQEHGRQTGCGY